MYRHTDWFRISIFHAHRNTKYDLTLIDYLLDLVSGSTACLMTRRIVLIIIDFSGRRGNAQEKLRSATQNMYDMTRQVQCWNIVRMISFSSTEEKDNQSIPICFSAIFGQIVGKYLDIWLFHVSFDRDFYVFSIDHFDSNSVIFLTWPQREHYNPYRRPPFLVSICGIGLCWGMFSLRWGQLVCK